MLYQSICKGLFSVCSLFVLFRLVASKNVRLSESGELDQSNAYYWRATNNVHLMEFSCNASFVVGVPCGSLFPPIESNCPSATQTINVRHVDTYFAHCVDFFKQLDCDHNKITMFARYSAVFLCGQDIGASPSFEDMTVRFGYVNLMLRAWSESYNFGYILMFFIFVYVNYINHIASTQTSLTKFIYDLVVMSIVVWVVDSLFFFLTQTQHSTRRLSIAFLFHVMSNLIIVGCLLTRQRWALVVGMFSVLVGGAGGYIAPGACMFLLLVENYKLPRGNL